MHKSKYCLMTFYVVNNKGNKNKLQSYIIFRIMCTSISISECVHVFQIQNNQNCVYQIYISA